MLKFKTKQFQTKVLHFSNSTVNNLFISLIKLLRKFQNSSKLSKPNFSEIKTSFMTFVADTRTFSIYALVVHRSCHCNTNSKRKSHCWMHIDLIDWIKLFESLWITKNSNRNCSWLFNRSNERKLKLNFEFQVQQAFCY